MGGKPDQASNDARRQFQAMLHELQVHQVELEMQNEELRESRKQLELSRNKYLELFENAPMGYLLIDAGYVIADANDTALDLLQTSRRKLVGNHCSFLAFDSDRLDLFRHVQRVFESRGRIHAEFRLGKGTGGYFHAEIHSSRIRDEIDGQSYCLSAFCDDSSRWAAIKALEESEERLRIVADYTYDWESWIDPGGAALYVSPACERITGYARSLFIDNPLFLREIIFPEDIEEWDKFFTGKKDHSSLDFRIVHKNGGIRWVSQVRRRIFSKESKELGMRYSIRDITRRKTMELQLRFQALHDPLTGLPNRLLCRDRIQHALERSRRRKGSKFSIVYMDIDKFKQVNDTLGHEAGDMLLVEVGKRLLGCVRGMDSVARFGGDEFVILLEELQSRREVLAIVQRILEALREPFLLQGNEIHSSGSLGVAHGGKNVADPEDLVHNANIAMHCAKERGRDCFKVFNIQMRSAMKRMADLGLSMGGALQRNEYYTVLQPIVGFEDLRIMGFEILSRWRHPEKGTIYPAEFIAAAEETGLIVELGRRVLAQVCEIGAEWLRQHDREQMPLMSMNVSRRELFSPNFVDRVKNGLQRCGFPPGFLCLEFSESAAMEDESKFTALMNALKKIGVTLALDDFGKGASSINSLKKFPFDLLKIDTSLAGAVDRSPAQTDCVRAIVELAHSLGMRVVAEGVSARNHFHLLKTLGCDYGQGYYLAEPQGRSDCERLLQKGISLRIPGPS